ncbi:MAG: DUF5916 domain-containing protein [Gammaproteobacteria bacterium]
MSRLTGTLAPILILAFAIATPAFAAPTSPAPAPATIPDLAPWIGSSGKPGVAAWRHAAHFSVNNEIQPGHNRPAPVATEASVGYTETALWLRFAARDPHPANVRVKYRRHDGIDNSGEYVGVIFSPFNDTQSGYEFFCSAGGTELDLFRQQGNEYASFDAIWYCQARLTQHGYTVTMEIPFRSLKFPHSDRPQTWRMLFFRNWARSVRHQITQVRLDYNSNCTLCQAELVRTQTPINAQRGNFQLIPAATISRTDARSDPSSGLERGSPKVSGGLDARWAIRPDLAWSATLNPNFSQVAPDVLQPTVNQRFAIYYPENRPFFERGTWVFNTPGFDFGQYDDDNRLVDTRQIADPHWASKVVGQIGNQALGALVADDSITNILLPGEQSSTLKSFNFSTQDALLRYRYDFPGHSTLGFLATGRRGGGYDNGVIAMDGSWQIDPSDSITIQTAHSTTTYPDEVANAFGITPGQVTGNGWGISWQHTRSNYNASLAVGHVDPGFRADLGYQPQVDYTEVQPGFEYDWYSHTAWWNTGGFGGNYDWVQATGGGPVLDRQAQAYAFVHAVGQSHVVFYVRHEDQYFSGETFGLNQYELDASAQPAQWLSFELDTTAGDGVDYVGVRNGGLLSIAPSFTLSPGRHLKIDFVGNFERLNVAGGRLYTANLYDLRIAWYFNSRMFVRAIAQEQNIRKNVALYPPGTASRTRNLATQWLFGYVLNPYTSLFAGFTNNYLGTGDAGLLQQGRTYFVKLSYAFQI